MILFLIIKMQLELNNAAFDINIVMNEILLYAEECEAYLTNGIPRQDRLRALYIPSITLNYNKLPEESVNKVLSSISATYFNK